MQTETLSVTLHNAKQLVSHAEWRKNGLHVRFADGCICVVPPADALQGRSTAPTSIAISTRPPVGLILHFGKDELELPWDWLRGYGDADHVKRAQASLAATKSHIGQRLRDARAQAGLSQEALARASGVSRATIARLEADQGGVTLITLERLAAALGRAFVEVF